MANMITRLIRHGRILALGFPFGHDETQYDIVKVDKEGIFEPDPNETGFTRLKKIFGPYQDHPVHPDLVVIVQSFFGSFIIGGLYGGIRTSRTTFINFIERNEATLFRNHLDAKRQLSDKMFTSLMKGFVIWGKKVSFFCTSFTIAYTTLSVYRNKDSFLHYPLCGVFAGAMYKIPLGPKGMVSGAFFGGVFGSVYASMKYGLLALANVTEDDIKDAKYQLKIDREENIRYAKHKAKIHDEQSAVQPYLKSGKL